MAEAVNPLVPNAVYKCLDNPAMVVHDACGRAILHPVHPLQLSRDADGLSIDDRLVDSIDPDLSCPVCLGLLKDPTLVTPCGHACCRGCLETVMVAHMAKDDDDAEGNGDEDAGNGDGQCPTCRGKIVRAFLTPALAQRKAVANVRVRCPAGVARILHSDSHALLESTHGCTAEYPLERHDAHMAVCQFALVMCKNWKADCKFYNIRRRISQHEECCPFATVNCSAATQGCTWSGLRQDLATHASKCTHMAVLQSKEETATVRARMLQMMAGLETKYARAIRALSQHEPAWLAEMPVQVFLKGGPFKGARRVMAWPDDNVSVLTEKVEELASIPPASYFLTWQNKCLDKDASLKSYEIPSDSTLLVRYRNGYKKDVQPKRKEPSS